jgi:hypothetical protein
MVRPPCSRSGSSRSSRFASATPQGRNPFAPNPIGKDGLAFKHDDLDAIAREHGRQRTAANPSTHNHDIRRRTGHHNPFSSTTDYAKRNYETTFNDWR